MEFGGEASDRSTAVNAAIEEWKSQATQDRSQRAAFGYLLLVGLLIQAISVNTAFFLIGYKKLAVDEWTARLFILSVFSELSAMVFFIVKYLFSRDAKGLDDLIRVLYRVTKDQN